MIKIEKITISWKVNDLETVRVLDDIIIEDHPEQFHMSIYATTDGITFIVQEEKPVKLTFEPLTGERASIIKAEAPIPVKDCGLLSAGVNIPEDEELK